MENMKFLVIASSTFSLSIDVIFSESIDLIYSVNKNSNNKSLLHSCGVKIFFYTVELCLAQQHNRKLNSQMKSKLVKEFL